MRWLRLEKLTFGIRFDRDRETVTLIYFSYFYIILFSLISILLEVSDEELIPISYRYHSMIGLGILLLVLIRFRLYKLAKALMLSIPPFLILLAPALAGLHSDEFYFWFPYIPIALSLIPHFILHVRRERISLYISLSIYFLLAVLIDDYLILMSEGSEDILPIIEIHRFYYSLIPVIIFLFVNLALGIVLSENYRYEQIAVQRKDELIQSEKMASLGTMTAGIAHEINNPLNFISSGLHATRGIRQEFIDEGEMTEKKIELIERMDKIQESTQEGIKRVSGIVSSMAFFANPGKAEKQEIELNSILNQAWKSLEKTLGYDIQVIKEFEDKFSIYCYGEQMQQVFRHILDNAIKALEKTRPGTKKLIHISATVGKKYKQEVCYISFFNTGPEIPEEDLNKIYDPFFTSSDPGKGPGMGMAISYMIVKEHKGWIEAKNKDDGIEFRVILPLFSSA